MSAEKAASVPRGLKGSRSKQNSPDTSSTGSNTSTSSIGSIPLSRQASDPGVDQSHPAYLHHRNSPSQRHRASSGSQDPVGGVSSAALMSTQTETLPVCTANSPSYSDIPDLASTSPHNASILQQGRPLILQHRHHTPCPGNEATLFPELELALAKLRLSGMRNCVFPCHTGTQNSKKNECTRAASLPIGLKGSHSQQNSPDTSSTGSNTSTSSIGSIQLSRQASDPGVDQSHPAYLHHRNSPSQRHRTSSGSQDPVSSAALMSQTQTETLPVCTANSPSYSDIPDLASTSPHNASILQQGRPLILQHQYHSHVTGSGEEASINWLYDFYSPNIIGTSPKDKLASFPDQQHPGAHNEVPSFPHERQPTSTVFRAQEKYVVTLGAPTSIAQRTEDDTLTYLNKGQFYSLYCKANNSPSVPDLVKTVVSLTFFDEPDKRVEFNHWQYWYNLQPNPNQRAFDIDRKSCENLHCKPDDIAYNATSFVWCPKLVAKIVLRMNCLSTEFSSQKGVKGLPLHIVIDTYEDLEDEAAEPVHRAYCRVKIFRDKGAERKNKDETKSVERRMQKFMKQQPGASLDSDMGPSAVFHPPSKETALASTSTFGPKSFLFIPQQVGLGSPLQSGVYCKDHKSTQDGTGMALPPSKMAATNLLASIRERETKRTFSNTLTQAKEDLDHLEVGVPAKKAATIPNRPLTTVYVRKEEEKVYNALLMDSLTVHDFKLQIANKYDVPGDMIKNAFKMTKRGLLVYLNDQMIEQFQDEDDFIIGLQFDNQKGCFDLVLHY